MEFLQVPLRLINLVNLSWITIFLREQYYEIIILASSRTRNKRARNNRNATECSYYEQT